MRLSMAVAVIAAFAVATRIPNAKVLTGVIEVESYGTKRRHRSPSPQ